MSNVFVPSPPNEEFFDSLFATQQFQPSSVKSLWSTENQVNSSERSIQEPFRTNAFYDHSQQQHPPNIYRHFVPLLQTVPSTPALEEQQQPFIPQTVDRRLNFSFDDPTVPEGKSIVGLRPVTEIAERYQSVFNGFSYFNLVQSKVFDDVMYSDSHLVTSAPTGSGKTVIFELAIVRVLMQMSDSIHSLKIVYVAPIKALCTERYEDWTAKFGSLGLHCSELTGDSQLDDYFELQKSQIIMTTPEKWDSMTRKWRDNKSLVQLVQLFLIDEVHQLNDESRGPTVEAIVSRMKTVRTSVVCERGGHFVSGGNVLLRFIAVSATIPNIRDIASWLGSEAHPAITHCIDETHRPVQLRRVVLGFPDATTDFKFDLSLNYKLSGIVQCYSDQKPTLVFCATRKGTQQAASVLVKDARFVMNGEHKRRLQSIASTLNDSKLREIVVYGVGYHHAGMTANDRKTIEVMFTNGELPVLFATSTLAMGVNLPAHLVIIKSTLHYVGGMFQEYSESQVLQMIGRAGRPQFDITATAVIMTRNSTKFKYEALLSGTQVIESNLHAHLIEHLNAEIVLHTITDVSIALDWMKSTFLYIRIKKNPKYYSMCINDLIIFPAYIGIPVDLSPEKLEEKLQEMCLKDLHLLEAQGLINMEDGFTLVPTDYGRMMARYYVAFESMKRFLNLKGTETLGELVQELSQCEEFQEVRLRVNEKRILNQLNKDKHRATIRFPMSGKMKSTDMKVNCLIQATLGCLPIQEFGLNQDIQKIFRSASRLCRCLMELLLLGSNFTALLNAVLLYKCVQTKLWENSKHVAKQLDKIGVTLSTTLVNAGLTTFKKILETNARELELIVNRHPPFGNQVKEAVTKLPQYSITIEQSSTLASDQADLMITLTLVNHSLLQELGCTAGPGHTCLLLIGDEDNRVVMKQKIMDSQLLPGGRWSKRISIVRANNGTKLQFYYISLEYVGLDLQQSFTPQYSHKFIPPAISSKQENDNESKKKERPDTSSKERQTQCSHRCINKSVCGHDCCKYGLPIDKISTDIGKEHTHNRYSKLSTSSKTTPRKKPTNRMATHINELHSRVQSIPPTPGLKRIKITSSDYRDYLSPSNLKQQFSYTPREKLTRSLPLSSSPPLGTPTYNGPLYSIDGGDDDKCTSTGGNDMDFYVQNNHPFEVHDEEFDEFASLDQELLNMEFLIDETSEEEGLPPSPPPLPPPLTQLKSIHSQASLQQQSTPVPSPQNKRSTPLTSPYGITQVCIPLTSTHQMIPQTTLPLSPLKKINNTALYSNVMKPGSNVVCSSMIKNSPTKLPARKLTYPTENTLQKPNRNLKMTGYNKLEHLKLTGYQLEGSKLTENQLKDPPAKKLCQRNIFSDRSLQTSTDNKMSSVDVHMKPHRGTLLQSSQYHNNIDLSFFTSKTNNSDDDSDLFGAVFAGIF